MAGGALRLGDVEWLAVEHGFDGVLEPGAPGLAREERCIWLLWWCVVGVCGLWLWCCGDDACGQWLVLPGGCLLDVVGERGERSPQHCFVFVESVDQNLSY